MPQILSPLCALHLTECCFLCRSEFRGASISCDYKPLKSAMVSCSLGFQPESGHRFSAALKLGEQNLNEMDKNWNLKAELRLNESLTRRQAELDFFVPLSFPFSL